MQKILISIILVISSLGILAQSTSEASATPKYSNEFLTLGAGAEGLAMSGAYTALADGAFAGYWNPAALNKLDSNKIYTGAMHSEYFAGIAKYDVLSVAKRLDNSSAAGITLLRFGVDDIPNTTQLIDAQGNLDYDRITSFSADHHHC